MAEAKTKQTSASVAMFLDGVEPEEKKQDCLRLVEIMREITGEEPNMWGSSIVGFGTYHYRYDSGHEGDSCIVGFSPRKAAITLYLMLLLSENAALLAKLGPHKTGKGCLYIKRLADVDENVLTDIIKQSVTEIKKRYS